MAIRAIAVFVLFAASCAGGQARRSLPRPREKPTARLALRDFGARCDGRADDTIAFQHALVALRTVHGGRLMVPKGICDVDHLDLTGLRGVVIAGQAGASVIRVTGDGGGACQPERNGGVRLFADSVRHVTTGWVSFRSLTFTYSNNALDCLFNVSAIWNSSATPSNIDWDHVVLDGDLLGATTKAVYTSNVNWLSFTRGIITGQFAWPWYDAVGAQIGTSANNVVSITHSTIWSPGPYGQVRVTAGSSTISRVGGSPFNLLWPSGSVIDLGGDRCNIVHVLSAAALRLDRPFRGLSGVVTYWLPHADITLGQAQGFSLTDDDLETQNSGQALYASNGQHVPADFFSSVTLEGNWIGDTNPGISGVPMIFGDLQGSLIADNTLYSGRGDDNSGIEIEGAADTVRGNFLQGGITGTGISLQALPAGVCNACREGQNTIFMSNSRSGVGRRLAGAGLQIEPDNINGLFWRDTLMAPDSTGYYIGAAANSTGGPGGPGARYPGLAIVILGHNTAYVVNPCAGITPRMSAGSVTVTDSCLTGDRPILLTEVSSSAPQPLSYSVRSGHLTIRSASPGDHSQVAWSQQ